MADVSGQGVAAALIMSVMQASLRIFSADTDESLPHLMAKIDRFLFRSTPANSTRRSSTPRWMARAVSSAT